MELHLRSSAELVERSRAPGRWGGPARGLAVSLMLTMFLSSCVGHEERLPSGKTVRVLGLYKDEGVAASIPQAYGTALVVSYCVTGATRQLSNEALGILKFAEDRAAALGATTIVLDRHESALTPLFGCGSPRRSAYMHERNNDGNDEWYRVLPR